MRPSEQARRAAAITLSKGKMYEYRIPVEDHIDLPEGLDLEDQFPLAIGTIGDYAAEKVDNAVGSLIKTEMTDSSDVQFAAKALHAFVEARTNGSIEHVIRLLSSAGHYLAGRPGDSVVVAKGISQFSQAADPLAAALHWALGKPWSELVPGIDSHPLAKALLVSLAQHFRDGISETLASQVRAIRSWAYAVGTPHELLFSDLLGAVSLYRMERSAWNLLPTYSGLERAIWAPYLQRATAVQEMWPSQQMMGVAGLYSGQSAVVQMPTSAGKSRATELVIRSTFLAKRTKLAIVVAPFRALCQEIASSLRDAFVPDRYQVNQVSDALQPDFVAELSPFFDGTFDANPSVVILTPEKLLYILRQSPLLIGQVGLIVYDEGHQFDTGSRGVTYELLLTSIKRLLPKESQSVLISAVIRNAPALASWLLDAPEHVVANSQIQTDRLVAFVSWRSEKGDGQLHFTRRSADAQDFFVPRVITLEVLPARGRETKQRIFPSRKSGPIALYLSLRVLPNGAAAIFCGTKRSAAALVRESVKEVFERGSSQTPPATYSAPDEIEKMRTMYSANFGDESYLTKAAALGIFAHHGNTPHGIRLAIEYGMRANLLRLVVCTSTLAQGVNLPIRYLFITSTWQGEDEIRARDFHNLMGRAGRAGMHGEGTVVFTGPDLFDKRKRTLGIRKWEEVTRLLEPESSEPTGSSLREVLAPLMNDRGWRELAGPSRFDVVRQLVRDPTALKASFDSLSTRLRNEKFSTKSLHAQIESKEEVLAAIESFLMAYRATDDSESFYATARDLAEETFAYSLATEEERQALVELFDLIAKRIESQVSDVAVQARYGKTLLGLAKARRIDEWLEEKRFELEISETDEDILDLLWPLLIELTRESRLHDTDPPKAIQDMAKGWIAGKPYSELLLTLSRLEASFPYGEKRRNFTIDMVIGLCEQAFGYEFGLLLAAASAAIEQMEFSQNIRDGLVRSIEKLQKRLKYGLPSATAISLFEIGFSERVVAQALVKCLDEEVVFPSQARRKVVREKEKIARVLAAYPSYFADVYRTIVDSTLST